MANLILRQRLSETSFALNIALSGVVQEGETATKAVDIYWRWEDEPDSEPQYLASGVAGFPITVPFDPKGREIRFYMISKTETGFASDRNVREAEQIVFDPIASRPDSGECCEYLIGTDSFLLNDDNDEDILIEDV